MAIGQGVPLDLTAALKHATLILEELQVAPSANKWGMEWDGYDPMVNGGL